MGYRVGAAGRGPRAPSRVRGDIVDVFPPALRAAGAPRVLRRHRRVDAAASTRRRSARVELLKAAHAAPRARALLHRRDPDRRRGRRPRRRRAQRRARPRSVRETLEQIREGIPAVGLEALLPGFFEGGLAHGLRLPAALGATTPLVYARRSGRAWTARAEELRSRDRAQLRPRPCTREGPDARRPSSTSSRRRACARGSRAIRVLEGGGLSLDAGGEPPVRLPLRRRRTDLREAILSHHGEEGALTPLVERLERWRDDARRRGDRLRHARARSTG